MQRNCVQRFIALYLRRSSTTAISFRETVPLRLRSDGTLACRGRNALGELWNLHRLARFSAAANWCVGVNAPADLRAIHDTRRAAPHEPFSARLAGSCEAMKGGQAGLPREPRAAPCCPAPRSSEALSSSRILELHRDHVCGANAVSPLDRPKGVVQRRRCRPASD